MDGGRDATPVEQEDRAAARLDDPPESREERCGERVARLAPQVDDADAWQRGADALAQGEVGQAPPALGSWRRAAVHRHGALQRGALGRHAAGVVAGIGVLLVRRIVLLVDHDQADVAHRCEDRAAGADDDPRLTPHDAVALVATLGATERGVQDRDDVAEALAEPTHGLRRERDLRDEHDRAAAAGERRGARLQVDLRLAAAGRPLEQHVLAAAGLERRDDARDGRSLVGREALGLRLPRQRLAAGRRVARAARRTACRRDERERPGGGRAVVLGDPEGEVDEGRGQLVEQAPDRRRPHAGRCLDADLGDDAAGGRAPDPQGDDRPLADAFGDDVRERTRERAGRHERVDVGEGHPASVPPTPADARGRDHATIPCSDCKVRLTP